MLGKEWKDFNLTRAQWEARRKVANIILQHCADRTRKRTGAQIAAYCQKELGVKMLDVAVRGIVNWYDSQGILPVIASGRHGYWRTELPGEIQSTIDHNESRIRGVRRKLSGLHTSLDLLESNQRKLHLQTQKNPGT